MLGVESLKSCIFVFLRQMVMSDDKYLRSINDLEDLACNWWPIEVRAEAQKMSILQYLLDTQERFISILKLADKNNPEKIFELLNASSFDYHLFLKHLVLLTDLGAEQLQRINKVFSDLFPAGSLTYKLKRKEQSYQFESLPVRGALNNKKMKIDTLEHLKSSAYDKSLCKDLIMVLIYGASSVSPRTRAVLYKCNCSDYLGDDSQIEDYVRKNYIRVSKIIAGKVANDLGNVAQVYALNYLSSKLGPDYHLQSNGKLPDVSENDGKTWATFDILVDKVDDTSKYKAYVGVEVSFQETSNSVIERKATIARNRFLQVVGRRSYVAYIIDGIGNFSRSSAVRTLCENSHCNVAYTPEEFDVLVDFIREKLK